MHTILKIKAIQIENIAILIVHLMCDGAAGWLESAEISKVIKRILMKKACLAGIS